MKVKGILKTITDDNKILLKHVPVKLNLNIRILSAKIDGKDMKFVFPSPIEVNCDRPIMYSITDTYPIINPDRITRIPNPTKRFLEVRVK
jgi:hypothetical protein